MSAETWAPIPGYEWTHMVSSIGRVMRSHTKHGAWSGKILGGCTTKAGYRRVKLCAGSKVSDHYVHRIVLLAHAGPASVEQCRQACHCDGDPANNQLSNLRWDTPEANYQDQREHGTNAEGERHGMSKLSDQQRYEICKSDEHRTVLALGYGVDESTIRYVRHQAGRK